jgi:septum site-determining protein MinD
MAKFISVMSGKGGVGKTTTSINLALAMHIKGSDVILLEGNLSSPNLSIHLGGTYFPVTIHDVMQKQHPIKNAIYEHHTGLKIIPADMSVDAMALVNFEELKRQSHDLHLHGDFIIIDGSPGLGRETTHLIDMSDEILVVTNPDPASVVDAKRLIDFARKFGKIIIGVIVSKHKNRRYKLKIEEIETLLGTRVIGVIPECKKFEKSLHQKKPYIHLYPRKRASKEYSKLASIITGRVL